MEDVSILSCFIDRCHLFPSWPPSLVCILVEGAQTSPTHCSAWKYIEKWVSPYFPYVFISDSLSMRRNRFSTGSWLLGLPMGGPVELGMEHHTDMAKQQCSCTEPSPPLGLFLTSPGIPLTLLACFTRWIDSALGSVPPSFRTGTPQMMLTLYRRIWLKKKDQTSSF